LISTNIFSITPKTKQQMGQQTVVGMFDSAEDAQRALSQLQEAGFSRESYDVATRPSGSNASYSGNYSGDGSSDSRNRTDSDHYNESGTMVEGAADAAGRGAEKTGSAIGRFFNDLFGDDEDEATRYTTVAQRSCSIVTVHCDSRENAERAAEILDDAGAVDVDERAAQYGYTSSGRTDAAGEESLKVMREDVHIGKREVETGGARLRARVVERPVEEHVRLREEHVFVDRQPVDRPATEADFNAFREGTIEMRERAEIPVVQKEARVVEEVRLGKEATERSETVRETARNTEVDVERLESDDIDRGTNRNPSSSSDNSPGSRI
jgi:stress response protein YsnF